MISDDHDQTPIEVSFRTTSPEETEQLGERLGARLAAGDVVCLAGPLGAGKTCLTRGLARGWGAQEPVTSPTFTLINEYRRLADAQRFYHVDCYRLSGLSDALSTGLEDVLDADGVVVIEWPERIAALIPLERVWITIRDAGESLRDLVVEGSGERAASLLSALVHD